MDNNLSKIIMRLQKTLAQDEVVRQTVMNLRQEFDVDRVVIYYFYKRWKGQVTFESLRDESLSIFGNTGPDECFNGEYAQMYLAGRVRAISDIETAAIEACHRDFLRGLKVQANLVVPVLNKNGLWGLLIAHQCRSIREWTPAEIELMQRGAEALSIASSIRDDLV